MRMRHKGAPDVRRRSRSAALGCSFAAVAIAMSPSAAAAQFYEPNSGASPLTLLESPAQPFSYYERKMRVRALIGADATEPWVAGGRSAPGAAAAAEPLAEMLVREYPRDPDNWLLLATAKRLLNKHAEAAAAFERQGAIAGPDPYSALNAAVSYMAAGRKKEAMNLLRTEIKERGTLNRAFYFYEEGLAALRDDPEFLDLVGRPDSSSWSRNEGWQKDLEFLVSEIRRANSDYRGRSLPAEFLKLHDQLKRDIPNLGDEQILVGMNRMLASLHQGHTNLWELEAGGPIAPRYLPVMFHAFPEGIFIIHAAPQYQALVGSRVAAVGGTPGVDALRQVSALVSGDGDMEYVWKGAYLMSSAPLLKGLGIINSTEAAELTVETPSGVRQTVRLTTVPDLSWTAPRAPGKQVVDLNGYRGIQNHFEKALPEHDALLVQFNQVRDDPEEGLQAFGSRLHQLLQANPPKNLILDMRSNAGGNTALYSSLLRALTAYSLDEDGRIYVLTGRRTYSAAANFITDLERLADPIFVGEPPSECCNLHGDASHFLLPYSKAKGSTPAVNWNLSSPFDERREIAPDVPVQLTASDYFAGRDTVMKMVYKLIAARE